MDAIIAGITRQKGRIKNGGPEQPKVWYERRAKAKKGDKGRGRAEGNEREKE
jgi:hypothetical protein